MAEEGPLPLPLSSVTSPLSLELTTADNDNDENNSPHQPPILTLSSPCQPGNLEIADSGIQETRSPNEPKTYPHSLTPPPFSQEVPEHDTGENVSGSSFLDKGTELLGTKSVGFERNGAIREELGDSSAIVENQSVASEMGKARKIPKKCLRYELGERNKNLGGFLLHKLMNSRFEGSTIDSGLALTRSVKVEVIDETALIDVSRMVRKIDKRRERKDKAIGRCRRFVYSRIEMEELRFINFRGQEIFWQEIYHSFGENVKREYEQLSNFRHHLKPEERHQIPGSSKYYGKGILGMAAGSRTWNDPNLFVY